MSFQDNPYANNPYETPQTPGGGFDQKPPGADLSRLKLPAIFMMIISVLSIAWMIFDFIMRIININAGNVPVIGDNQQAAIIGAYIGAGIDVINVIAQIVVIAGCIAMLKGRGKGIAKTASILSMIPCITSGCCILNIPFGIWAFVVLKDPAIERAMDDADRMM